MQLFLGVHFPNIASKKGEVGYEFSTSKWSNSDSSSSVYLLSNWLNSLMVLLNRPFSRLSMPDNVIAFRCSSVIYPHLLLSPSHFQNSLSTFSIERVNGIPLSDFYPSDFQRALKNNNHSRIIYRNDNIARLVKT